MQCQTIIDLQFAAFLLANLSLILIYITFYLLLLLLVISFYLLLISYYLLQ